MSVLHYLSSNASKRAQFIFNAIAPIYAKIDFNARTHYRDSVFFVNHEIDIKGKSVLDIGTGSGDWGAMFFLFEAQTVHGVDFARKMLAVGKVKNPELTFSWGNAEDLTEFEDNSFDVVTASFVLHGVKEERRIRMLSEMKRIARTHVVLHDFVGTTPLIIRIVEFFERSDYRFFKKNIVKELEQQFPRVSCKRIHKGAGVYIACL